MFDKMDNVCRLCTEHKNEMLSIFGEEGLQRKIAQKLRACLPVLVYKTDPLPKQICQFCAARLDDAYEFREYCLNVYKNMYVRLLTYKQIETVRIFLDAMKNSHDPCQAQLCKEKSRAPPPLVPIPISLPLNNLVTPTNQIHQEQFPNIYMEMLPELPCEVEIKEMNADPIFNMESACGSIIPINNSEIFNVRIDRNNSSIHKSDMEENNIISKINYQMDKEERQTSILEQALTGHLTDRPTMNNRPKLKPKIRLTSEWCCALCNNYYRTKESLVKHLHLQCLHTYTCKTCSASFDSVENLARHEVNHLRVVLGSVENLNDCTQCNRQFINWKMLRQHKLFDHANITVGGTSTWCSLCNRSFFTIRSYQNHIQLHQRNDNLRLCDTKPTVPVLKAIERLKNGKRGEQFSENAKTLSCHVCGKVCTQQSALSNHMRTHEPKKFKCDICGRSFGLFIRLVTHRMAEHNKQPTLSAVEQEEALNAEREALEAREARNLSAKNRQYFEMIEKDDIPTAEESTTQPYCGFKVARCGLCQQWFSNHTAMLEHLRTHSENYSARNFVCSICNRSFKEKWQLVRHEACHKRSDNTSLHTCIVCNKSFMDKNAYKAHQKTHTVDKSYHCAKCNQVFLKDISLLTHQCTNKALSGKSMTPELLQETYSNKRYKCSKCNSSFASLQSRNSHMRIHSVYNNKIQKHNIKIEPDDESMPKLHPETSLEYNMLPIEPKIEIKEQSIPPRLKRTLIKTAGRYRCGVCKSPFVSRDLAVAHLRSAHPVMPYQCPYCKETFMTQYVFTHHIRTKHLNKSEK